MNEAPQKLVAMKYRPDIDGLRAVAVLLVIAFHVGVAPPAGLVAWVGGHLSSGVAQHLRRGVPGGFIGVDIFFVISGFLISGILLREQSNGTFSIVRFYERRIRRIFPALIAVLLFTFGAAWFALLPYELRELGQSMLAALFSAANIYFLRHSGYFEPDALGKPLLHTWSLAVEEQFYLVFPPLLHALHRLKRNRLKATVILLAVASFAYSVLDVRAHPNAAFYLPFSRAWELLLGTILALGVVPAPRSPTLRNAVSLTGLVLILAPAFLYSSATPFPGGAALAPCLGASLIILAGSYGDSVIGRLLSSRPAVFVGLISYSLYLWHWPLLLINRYEYFPYVHLSAPWLLLVMIGVAALSWRLVEQPFRAGPHRPSRRAIFVAAGASVLVMTALSLWVRFTNGVPSRFPRQVLALAAYTQSGWNDAQWHSGCFVDRAPVNLPQGCLAADPARPQILLFGDSHAAHLREGLEQTFPEFQLSEAAATNCKPLLTSAGSPDSFCRQLTAAILHGYLVDHHPAAVLLSASWQREDLPGLAETVAYLRQRGQRVLVLGPSPAYDQPLPTLLVKAIFRHDPGLPGRHLVLSWGQYAALDEALQRLALGSGAARYLSLRDILCRGSSCLLYGEPDVPLQFDGSHFTQAGSLLVAKRLRDNHDLP